MSHYFVMYMRSRGLEKGTVGSQHQKAEENQKARKQIAIIDALGSVLESMYCNVMDDSTIF
jgi:hypothetical protein